MCFYNLNTFVFFSACRVRSKLFKWLDTKNRDDNLSHDLRESSGFISAQHFPHKCKQ